MTKAFPIKSVSDLEKLGHAVKWQYFERLVTFIFEQNGFEAKTGTVFGAGGEKRQIDVIAEKHGTVYVVECKKWRSRERTSALRSAARKHVDRCDLYSIKESKKVVPLIVTLLDDSVEETEGVAVVPIMKLNSFLNDA